MKRPRICAAIVENKPEAVRRVESRVDLYEVRIDLVGDGWQELVEHLRKPWIACNRIAEEGGKWSGSEGRRIEQLMLAVQLGAAYVDIELRSNSLAKIVQAVKRRTKCLISYHNLRETPPIEELKQIVEKQIQAGADVCKVVTTAADFSDNLEVIRLIAEFPGLKLVSFAMGPLGCTSRVLCPMAGGDFTYASIEKGKESAPGQITVNELAQIYQIAGAG